MTEYYSRQGFINSEGKREIPTARYLAGAKTKEELQKILKEAENDGYISVSEIEQRGNSFYCWVEGPDKGFL